LKIRDFYGNKTPQPHQGQADEPTGNLDRAAAHNIMEIFRTLNRDRALTQNMITHDPEMASYARRQVVLRDGAIVSDQPVGHPAEARAEAR
jgi:putative ABC transport system ATP-binding protein